MWLSMQVKSTSFLCTSHVCNWSKAYIQVMSAFIIFKKYEIEKWEGCTLSCIYMGRNIQLLLQNRLANAYEYLVGIKYLECLSTDCFFFG